MMDEIEEIQRLQKEIAYNMGEHITLKITPEQFPKQVFCPELDAYMEKIKAEITEHAENQMCRINTWLDQFRFLCANENQVHKDAITEHMEKRALIECERIDNYGRSLLAFLSDHADKEIERMKAEMVNMEMCAKEVHVGLMIDVMKEIEKAADTEIERIKPIKEVKNNNLRDLFNLYLKSLAKAHHEGCWNQEEYDAILDLVNKEMIRHGY